MPTVPEATKKINTIEFAIERNTDGSGQTIFKFKVDPAITKLYANQAKSEKESTSWPGQKFFYVPEIIDNPHYKALLDSYQLRDDYGSRLYVNEGGRKGVFNIAWLRTVSGEGQIVVNDSIPLAELNILMRQTGKFIKEYFEEHFRAAKLKGRIEIDFGL